MDELDKLRNEINEIDNELVVLFEKRLETVLKIGEYKRRSNIDILNQAREEEIVKRGIELLKNKDFAGFLEDFLNSNMRISRELQTEFVSPVKRNSFIGRDLISISDLTGNQFFNKSLEENEDKDDKNVSKTFFGLLGKELIHSLSPSMHELIFKELNINAAYHLFEVRPEELKDAVTGLKTLGAGGVNVTIPYKVDVIKYLDEISREAQKIGSVNTICFREGKTIGYNTDYYGFGMLLEHYEIDIRDKKVLVLGTGGAAKGVIQYLLDKGIKDGAVASRDIERLKKRNDFKGMNPVSYEKIRTFKNWDIIINCTPCGMYPDIDSSPVEREVLYGFSTAVDLVYNPDTTLFLRYAAEAGLKTANGLYMLAGQGAKAQELWNNVNISRDIVDKIYGHLQIPKGAKGCQPPHKSHF